MITCYDIADFVVQIKHDNDSIFNLIHNELKFYESKDKKIGDCLIEINPGCGDFQIPKKALRIYSNKPCIKLVHDEKEYFLRPNELLTILDFHNKRLKIDYQMVNEDVFFIVRWAVKWLIIKTAEKKGLSYIHGAAVNYKGKNIIFAGDSCSGKSSCLFRTLFDGAKLISDDNTLLNGERLVTFFLKPTLRKDLIKRFEINDSETFIKNEFLHNTPGKIDLVIFPKIWNHHLSQMSPVSKDYALNELKRIYLQEIKLTELFPEKDNLIQDKYAKALTSAKCFTFHASNNEEEIKSKLRNFFEKV